MAVGGLCLAVLSCYLYLFYPGIISWDFYVQWWQAKTGSNYSDWHPFLYTLLLRGLIRIWNNPALVSIVQIGCFTALLVMTLRRLEQWSVPRVCLMLLAGLYIFHPLNGIYMVSFWKDISYGLSLWWLTLLLMDIAASRGAALGSGLFWLQLLPACLLVAIIRHNGILPVAGTMVLILIYYGRRRLSPWMFSAIFIVVLACYRGLLLPGYNVDTGQSNILKAHLPIQHIGAILQQEGAVVEGDAAVLNTFMPLSRWKESFDHQTCMPLIFGKDENGQGYLKSELLVEENSYRTFLNTWLRLVLANPLAVADYHFLASRFLWKINDRTPVFWLAGEDLAPEHLRSAYQPGSPQLRERVSRTAVDLIDFVGKSRNAWFLHKGALAFWLIVLVVSAGWVVGRWHALLLVAAPSLLQSLSLVLFPVVQDTRFIYPIMLTAPLIVALFWARRSGLAAQ